MVDPTAPQPSQDNSPPTASLPTSEGYRGEDLATLDKNAQNGDPVSAYKLGQVYALGLVGIEKNKEAALPYLKMAANEGHAGAAYLAAETLLAEYLFVATPPPKPVSAPEPLPETTPNVTPDRVVHYAPAPMGAVPTRARIVQRPEPIAPDPLLGGDSPDDAEDPAAADVPVDDTPPPPKITPQEAQLAVRYLYMASEKGLIEASVALGELQYRGDLIAQDTSAASKLFAQAAETGNADAQYYIGQMYFRGTGRPQNGYQAITWSRKAATNGSVLAQRALGLLYYNGYENLRPDKNEASRWLTAAAQNGDGDSARLLKLMQEGAYVPKSQIVMAMLPAGDIVRASDAALAGIRESREKLARGEPLEPITLNWGETPQGAPTGQTTVTPVPVAYTGAEQCWQIGHLGRQYGQEVRDEELVCEGDAGVHKL